MTIIDTGQAPATTGRRTRAAAGSRRQVTDVAEVRCQLAGLRKSVTEQAPDGQRLHPTIAHHFGMVEAFLGGLEAALSEGPTYFDEAGAEALRQVAAGPGGDLYALTRAQVDKLRDQAYLRGMAAAAAMSEGR